ncbi:MAG: hypothetical protein CMF52_08300 [Legionellales bacterium]|nr:hypothetical protein [Legionellales bacterium]HAV93738.1 hypothetical protein [Pseudomonadota bacterium]
MVLHFRLSIERVFAYAFFRYIIKISLNPDLICLGRCFALTKTTTFARLLTMNSDTKTKSKASQSTQYYTVDEANLMIPDLDLAFIRIKQMQIQVQELFKLVKKRGIDFVPSDDKQLLLLHSTLDDESIDVLSSLKLLLANIQEEINALSERGCSVASIDQGLVKWHCKLSDKVVYLSWVHGEKQVSHWCDSLDDSASRRRPLSELTSDDSST